MSSDHLPRGRMRGGVGRDHAVTRGGLGWTPVHPESASMAVHVASTPHVDAIVVGGGPAGLTAATYLGRFLRSCLVLDAGDSRAKWIPESNNCPGFPNGVAGVELLRRMKAQAMEFGAHFEVAEVTGIVRDGAGEGFIVAAGARSWRARCVVLATGLADRLPDVPWAD